MGKNERLLKNTESFSIELLLLSYPLLLLSGDITISPHYLLLVLSVIAGIGLYFLFNIFTYNIRFGLMISLFVAMPLFIIGIPLAPTILVGAYTFWRIHTNFSSERHARWNFMAVNTIFFTVFYLFTTIYLLQPEMTEFNQVNVVLFITTTVLSIVLRYFVVIAIGKRIPNFQFIEVNKMFSRILGIGAICFLTVYLFLESMYSVFISILHSRETAALFPDNSFTEKPRASQGVPGEELIYPTSSDQIDLSLFITIIIALIIVILILKNRKVTFSTLKTPSYVLKSFGLNKAKDALDPDHKEHLTTTNVVRLAYQNFEKDAVLAKSSRLAGETVKEWFHRMGWEQDNQLIMTYDKIRYGSLTIPDEESQQFIETLYKIKINNFNKNV